MECNNFIIRYINISIIELKWINNSACKDANVNSVKLIKITFK